MNFNFFAVLAAIVILVPAALLAAFRVSKDRYSFEEHYSEAGFSQEVVTDQGAQASADVAGQPQEADANDTESTLKVSPTSAAYPVREWPEEL